MAHSYRLGLVTWGYQVRIPVGTDICHRGCAYTVLQTVQRHGVYSAAYGTVHYKEPLKSFEIRVGHSPGFGLPSVAILPWLCRKRRKAIFIHSFWRREIKPKMAAIFTKSHNREKHCHLATGQFSAYIQITGVAVLECAHTDNAINNKVDIKPTRGCESEVML